MAENRPALTLFDRRKSLPYRKFLKPRVLVGGIILLYLVGLVFYTPKAYLANHEWNNQRQQLIATSPKVYLTRTGKKYHRAYHYHDRNFETTAYEATEDHYEACRVCQPPGRAQLLSPLVWYYDHWLAIGIVSLIVVGVSANATFQWAVPKRSMI